MSPLVRELVSALQDRLQISPTLRLVLGARALAALAQLRSELESNVYTSRGSETILLNLLAVLHRDGGQHTDQVGVSQSVADATSKWHALLTENDT